MAEVLRRRTRPAIACSVALAMLWLPWAHADLPRPRERIETPSLELLEFLGEMQDSNGDWVEPEFLSGLDTRGRNMGTERLRRDDDND